METSAQLLPKPTGPHTVGVWGYDTYDPSRTDESNPQGRVIPLHIYFPLMEGEHLPTKKITEPRAPQNYPSLEAPSYAQLVDLSRMAPGPHNLAIFNHANLVPMTEYASIVQDLASHGLVVITVQHQLASDPAPQPFSRSRSISRHATVIDNLLYLFECLKHNNATLFGNQLATHKLALIGHSMGANAALLLAQRTTSSFLPTPLSLFTHEVADSEAKECIVALDSDFQLPAGAQPTIFLALSEEWQQARSNTDFVKEIKASGHWVKEYQGTRHLSFKDHFYTDDPTQEQFFNGTRTGYESFWQTLRTDIRAFLRQQGIL